MQQFKVINMWAMERLEFAQGLKEHVLPVVGLDTVMIIADYATDTIDRFLFKSQPKRCCFYKCNVPHQRRISNLCKKHADACVVCLTGHTKNPRNHICADCAAIPANDYYKDLLTKMPAHEIMRAFFGPKQLLSAWMRQMQIQWNGPFLLQATPENQDKAMNLIEDSMFLIPTWVVSGLSEDKYGVTFTRRSKANRMYDLEDLFGGKLFKYFNLAVKAHNEMVNSVEEESDA
jgi:hypothetical protein